MFHRKATVLSQTRIVVILLHTEYQCHNGFKTETCQPQLIYVDSNNKGCYIHVSVCSWLSYEKTERSTL